jgi:hypothetical protein
VGQRSIGGFSLSSCFCFSSTTVQWTIRTPFEITFAFLKVARARILLLVTIAIFEIIARTGLAQIFLRLRLHVRLRLPSPAPLLLVLLPFPPQSVCVTLRITRPKRRGLCSARSLLLLLTPTLLLFPRLLLLRWLDDVFGQANLFLLWTRRFLCFEFCQQVFWNRQP